MPERGLQPNIISYNATLAALHTAASPNKVYHAELGNNGYPQYDLQYAACNNDAAVGSPSMLDVYREIIGLAGAQKARESAVEVREL